MSCVHQRDHFLQQELKSMPMARLWQHLSKDYEEELRVPHTILDDGPMDFSDMFGDDPNTAATAQNSDEESNLSPLFYVRNELQDQEVELKQQKKISPLAP